MTHQSQEVLIKVMCSERLPEVKSMFYCVELKGGEKHICLFSGHEKFILPYYYNEVIAWYEPATRIVLTVEELQDLLSDARSEGYGDGAVEGSSNR